MQNWPGRCWYFLRSNTVTNNENDRISPWAVTKLADPEAGDHAGGRRGCGGNREVERQEADGRAEAVPRKTEP